VIIFQFGESISSLNLLSWGKSARFRVYLSKYAFSFGERVVGLGRVRQL
jgi:hypothetical protein